MKREWTNKVRFVLDELIPPIIRDSRWFMWPFYVLAYRKFSVQEYMSFKSRAYSMSEKEYAEFYGQLGSSVSRNRVTDLNELSIIRLLSFISKNTDKSILDVGSGNGYLLERFSEHTQWEILAGVDVVPSINLHSKFDTYIGALPNLPFNDRQFDVVTCTHVLEHVLDVPASIKELVRIARNKLLVVVPRQRYYYHTLDEHLNFYPEVEPLKKLFSPFGVSVYLEGGDWVLEVNLHQSSGVFL